jgi:hypothetical protein
MIDSNVLKVSRDNARAKLDEKVARESFGYFIDVANDWETYRSPEELLYYFGIHKTHESQYLQILNDFGCFTPGEREWAIRFVEFYDRLGRMVSTTGKRHELQFDLAETDFDWRTVLKFKSLPAKILDFGAGGGRQCVSSFLRHPDNIYTAVDSVLASYVVQNLVYSFIDALRPRARFVDLLDCETAGIPMPRIEQAAPGTIFHVPGWFEKDPLPSRYYDIIMACHVHNELSGGDFLRLMGAVDKCLADDGIFYVRSELGVRHPKNYFDALDMHAIDVIDWLEQRSIVPVYCTYTCAFQTTVFARKGSSHHKMAQASTARENQFLDLTNSLDMSIRAGQHFVLRTLDYIAQNRKRTLFLGRDTDIFGKLVEPNLTRVPDRLVFNEAEAIRADAAYQDQVRAFNPEVIVAVGSSNVFFQMADKAKAAIGKPYAVTTHHIMPACFTFREMMTPQDPLLSTGSVCSSADVAQRLHKDAAAVFLDGRRLFGAPLPGTFELIRNG